MLFVLLFLFCHYSVLFSSIFISASTLCLEVELCGLLSVVLLLMLVLLSFDLLFLVSWFWLFLLGLLCLFVFEFWLFVFVLGQFGL